MKSQVAVITCSSYDEEQVFAAVERGVKLLGGMANLVKAGEEIVLKPNLLVGEPPEKAVNTHPAVFRAAARLFKEAGAKVSYGDSPAVGKPLRAAAKVGLTKVAGELDIPLADFQTAVEVSYPQALLAKRLHLVAGVLNGPRIVSLPKMKTHGLTRITGAIKNQFGCIPSIMKSEFHVKMPDIFEFSTVLVDITNYLKPLLYIMDGITAMEGGGPRGGQPFPMNVLLLSQDPAALDAVFCKLIDLNPEFVPFLKIAEQAGLGTYHFENIEILGDDVEPLVQKNFKATRRPADRFPKSLFPTYLKNLLSPRPVIHYDKCTNCGSCVKMCPVKPGAVYWPGQDEKIPHRKSAAVDYTDQKGNPKPVYDYKRCIRCYCCQEICPHQAITITIPLLGRIIYR